MDVHTADPTEVKDYPYTWVTRLEPGETLTAATWAVPAGITQSSPAPSFTPEGIAIIWLTGGTLDTLYKITSHVTTSMGRQYEGSFYVYVRDL